jgi:hypothetical protein
MMGVSDNEQYVNGPMSKDKGYYTKSFYVEEPAPIALKNSAIWFTMNTAAAGDFRISSGTQPTYIYQISSGGQQAGFSSIFHPVHKSGGLTLNRGLNRIDASCYTTTGWAAISNLSSILYLNYTSGKDSISGDGKHNHTIIRPITSGMRIDGAYISAAKLASGTILEPNYFINSVGVRYYNLNSIPMNFSLEVKASSNEFDGYGWVPIGNTLLTSDSERGPTIGYFRAGRKFRRHNNDPMKLIDIKKPRSWKVGSTSNTNYNHLDLFYTYHSISSNIEGTVTGYTSDGSNITVKAYTISGDINGEFKDTYIGSGLTIAGGKYSIPWFDDVYQVYTTAYQDSSHMGRSTNGTAL